MKFLSRFLTISSIDPDDIRRRRILNILLTVTGALSVVALVISLAPEFAWDNVKLIIIGSAVTFLGTLVIYLINTFWSGRIAATIFLVFMTIVFAFSDTPQQVSDGRTLFAFAIPIIMASILLAPWSSFIFSSLSGIIIAVIAASINHVPNLPAIIGFFVIALVSWLSARSLEQALKELRVINANLDQVVVERTQALTESLERERIEAGRNQAILNSIADGVVVFDTKWNAILANPALRGMLDLPIELIVNKNFRDLIEHPRLSPRSRGLLYAMMEHDTQPPSFRVEWGKKTLSISAAQVYDNSKERNTNIGTVTVFRDFTREAEVEKLKSTFVAIVSHELRTPLNAILGYAEMFKESVYGPMNDKQVNMAERIMKNTQRLLGLINDLLDQAQMEAGKLTIQMAPFRPAELLENMHGVMDQIVYEKGLRLTSEIEDNLPEALNGDVARLQQILVNLVNNAVKFTDHGTVHIRLFCPSGNRWGLEVSDSGRGIPESELPYIFDTFRQVEGSATRVHGGFGLGLSIVKQLVNLMNGEIRVRSKVDKGSTFTITLPVVIAEANKEKWRNL
ncbi:MAG TPA: ATP-binding protein [Anaerolineales bacterium]|nr:ATP-binding protein [Anaerolineales bacterium]HLO34416.1 ATP-binding protein [Anaerolineales bacterium]